MFVYDYTYLYRYTRILYNPTYAAEVSANQIIIALSFRDGIHDTQSMNYMYSLQQNIKQRERYITQNRLSSL